MEPTISGLSSGVGDYKMLDFATAIGSNFGIAGVIVLLIGIAALYIGFRRTGNPFIQLGGVLCVIASVVLLLMAFGYLDITWIADPQPVAKTPAAAA